MIAAFVKDNKAHIVYWTGRDGFSASSVAYCNTEHNAAKGVLQLPDAILDKPMMIDGRQVTCCTACKDKVRGNAG